MKKKLILLLIFILIILINLNSYASTDFSQVNYNYLNNLTDEEFIDFIRDFYNYLWPGLRGQYIFVNKTDFQYQFYTSLSPLIVRNYNYSSGLTPVGSLEGVPSNTFYNLQENYCAYNMTWINSSMIYNNGNSSSQSYHLANNSILLNNINNSNIIYSNFDIINIEDNSVHFAKNFDLQSSSEEGSTIVMTETNNILTENFSLIKAFLFLICLYLLCKVLYGVIWWLYNKTLL